MCAQIDPDLWFPVKGNAGAAAVKVCNMCPVQQKCLETALENDEQFGIWGGTSIVERRRIKQRLANLI